MRSTRGREAARRVGRDIEDATIRALPAGSKSAMSGECFNRVMAGRTRQDREVERRVAALWEPVRRELQTRLIESNLSHAVVARAAGVSPAMLGRVLAGERDPSPETLIRVCRPLNMVPSIRLFGGPGVSVLDHLQARVVEWLARASHEGWRPHPELPVGDPPGPPPRSGPAVRGSVDLVLEHREEPLLVAAEVYSGIRKLDTVLRWDAEKAAALAATPLARATEKRFGGPPRVSRLLLVLSTAENRKIAGEFATTLAAVYPAPPAEAAASLLEGAPWPGNAILWAAVEGLTVSLITRATPRRR
jgi:transcriptional regulator with XRE-family HTH domain